MLHAEKSVEQILPYQYIINIRHPDFLCESQIKNVFRIYVQLTLKYVYFVFIIMLTQKNFHLNERSYLFSYKKYKYVYVNVLQEFIFISNPPFEWLQIPEKYVTKHRKIRKLFERKMNMFSSYFLNRNPEIRKFIVLCFLFIRFFCYLLRFISKFASSFFCCTVLVSIG